MLILAAVLLIGVGLLHSVKGGKHLIAPILRMQGLPIILGSRQNTELTLWAGWHIASLFWCGNAAALLWIAFYPATGAMALPATLGVTCTVAGVAALWLSRGKHLSWVFFLPIAGLTICSVWVPI